MLLALDIGNTNITVGLFDVKNEKVLPNPLKVWRISTVKERTSDEYAAMLMSMFCYCGFNVEKLCGIAVASVVPLLSNVFEELLEKYFRKKVFFINHTNCGGLVFSAESSREAGADRIADVVAAYSIYGESCIVVDFGTATTFDCVDSVGKYIGGAIAPGLVVSAQSLSLKAELLPQVEIKKPSRLIGVTTVGCIQAGLYFGYIGLVKEIIARIRTEMEVKHIIATGGLARLISSEVKEIEIVLPDLTLEGIRIIWEKGN